MNIKIPVCELEFHEGSHTIWVHSPLGATVLRIKTLGKITVDKLCSNPVAHCDILVDKDIHFCLPPIDPTDS